MGLHGVCLGLPKFARVCLSLPKFAQANSGKLKQTLANSGNPRQTMAETASLPKFAKVWASTMINPTNGWRRN